MHTEEEILQLIEKVIRETKKAYGYRHLSDIGKHLRDAYPEFDPQDYGCKNLLGFIQKHGDIFAVKWSAPSKKGASHIWIRLAKEPKLKEGYK